MNNDEGFQPKDDPMPIPPELPPSPIAGSVELAKAICEAVVLEPNDVTSLTLHLGHSMVAVVRAEVVVIDEKAGRLGKAIESFGLVPKDWVSEVPGSKGRTVRIKTRREAR